MLPRTPKSNTPEDGNEPLPINPMEENTISPDSPLNLLDKFNEVSSSLEDINKRLLTISVDISKNTNDIFKRFTKAEENNKKAIKSIIDFSKKSFEKIDKSLDVLSDKISSLVVDKTSNDDKFDIFDDSMFEKIADLLVATADKLIKIDKKIDVSSETNVSMIGMVSGQLDDIEKILKEKLDLSAKSINDDKPDVFDLGNSVPDQLDELNENLNDMEKTEKKKSKFGGVGGFISKMLGFLKSNVGAVLIGTYLNHMLTSDNWELFRKATGIPDNWKDVAINVGSLAHDVIESIQKNTFPEIKAINGISLLLAGAIFKNPRLIAAGVASMGFDVAAIMKENPEMTATQAFVKGVQDQLGDVKDVALGVTDVDKENEQLKRDYFASPRGKAQHAKTNDIKTSSFFDPIVKAEDLYDVLSAQVDSKIRKGDIKKEDRDEEFKKLVAEVRKLNPNITLPDEFFTKKYSDKIDQNRKDEKKSHQAGDRFWELGMFSGLRREYNMYLGNPIEQELKRLENEDIKKGMSPWSLEKITKERNRLKDEKIDELLKRGEQRSTGETSSVETTEKREKFLSDVLSKHFNPMHGWKDQADLRKLVTKKVLDGYFIKHPGDYNERKLTDYLNNYFDSLPAKSSIRSEFLNPKPKDKNQSVGLAPSNGVNINGQETGQGNVNVVNLGTTINEQNSVYDPNVGYNSNWTWVNMPAFRHMGVPALIS